MEEFYCLVQHHNIATGSHPPLHFLFLCFLLFLLFLSCFSKRLSWSSQLPAYPALTDLVLGRDPARPLPDCPSPFGTAWENILSDLQVFCQHQVQADQFEPLLLLHPAQLQFVERLFQLLSNAKLFERYLQLLLCGQFDAMGSLFQSALCYTGCAE